MQMHNHSFYLLPNSLVFCQRCGFFRFNESRHNPATTPQETQLATDQAYGYAIVLVKVCDGLEVRCQPSGQPHQLYIALVLGAR